MNEEQYKSLTKEQQQELAEHSHADCEKYHERCDDNCDEMHPDKCKALVKQSRACQYKVISTLLSDESNAMVGIAYWTKLIDGGSAWIIHPIDCDSATVEQGTDHDTLTAHTHVYNKQMKFDMDLIQFVEHGPSYIGKFEETTQRILSCQESEVWQETTKDQINELCFSVRYSRESAPLQIKLTLCDIFKRILLWEDFISADLDEDILRGFRIQWLSVITMYRDKAKKVIQQELEELEDDEDYVDTVEEINLIIDMLNNIDAEYTDLLDGCNNINEILNAWPPILLPHPHPDVLDLVANSFKQAD